MITERDILEVLPYIHPAALKMILDTKPRTWADVEMALDRALWDPAKPGREQGGTDLSGATFVEG